MIDGGYPVRGHFNTSLPNNVHTLWLTDIVTCLLWIYISTGLLCERSVCILQVCKDAVILQVWPVYSIIGSYIVTGSGCFNDLLRAVQMKNAPRSLNSKGHSLGDLLEASMKFEARAKRLNEREAEKMERIQRSIVRNQRVSDNLRSRVMARTEASLQNISGFQKVVSKDYTVKKFKTMEKGFNQRYRLRPVSPRTARQLKLETRAYYSGLDRKWFQPEIDRKMRQQDPTKIQKMIQKVLKEDCEGRNQLLDRNLSEDAFQQEVYNRLSNKNDIKIARFHYTSNNKN